MLLRISLIVAILAGLGAGVVSYLEISDKIPALTQQRDSEKTAKNDALTKLATTEKNLKKTQGELASTQQELADTKGERDKAVARAEAQTKRGDELTDKLTKTKADLSTAQSSLAAYTLSGLTAEQVLNLNKTLKDAQTEVAVVNDEKAVLLRNVTKLQTKLNTLIGTNSFVTLRADLHGKIIVVDPKWNFVVLNIGEDQGVLANGELLVSRDGKLVAKVIVRTVEKDRSIANLVPGWKLGEMFEGDEVSPAHPAS